MNDKIQAIADSGTADRGPQVFDYDYDYEHVPSHTKGEHEHERAGTTSTVWVRAMLGGLMLLFALAGAGLAQAAETMTIQFTTSVTGSDYSPRNVHVAWIEDGQGNFIKTIGRWAATRRSNLKSWVSKAGSSDTDSVSGATQSNAGTFSAIWNLTPRGGTSIVADGTYRIVCELTCSNGGSPRNYAVYTFNKNGQPSVQNPASQGGYSNVTIAYTGRPVLLPDINLAGGAAGTLAFGSLAVNANVDKTFDIQNTGQSNLTVKTITLSGADAGSFSFIGLPALPFAIAPAGKQTITQRFTPNAGRTFTATVNVGSDAPGKATVSLNLTGQGVAPAVGLSLPTLNFGAVPLGGHKDLTVDINSTGGAALHVRAATAVGRDKAAYTLLAPPTFPLTLGALSGRQTLTVRFAPTAMQDYSHASLAIGCDDPNVRVTNVTLKGQGTLTPLATLTPDGSVGGPCTAVSGRDATHITIALGATLAIFDVSKPATPALTGQVRLPGPIRQMVSVNNVVYAATWQAGIMVVDATNPQNPKLVTTLATPGEVNRLSIAPLASGAVLCVADGMGGLRIFTLANPLAPVAAGNIATQGPACAVAGAGTLVYVLDQARGLQVISVADPTKPALQGALNQIELGQAMAVSSGKAYITDRLGRLFVVNLANPTAPAIESTFTLAGIGRAVTVSADQKAYIALENGQLQVLNVAAAPAQLGLFTVAGEVQNLMLSNTTAWVAAGTGGLCALDVTNPAAPVQLGAYASVAAPASVATADTMAWVTERGGAIKSLDLGSPAAARLRGATSALADARAIVLSGATAYVAAGWTGLQIVDITNPDTPVLKSAVATAGFANSVAVQGSLALVADGRKVYTIDMSNPAAPVVLGSLTTGGTPLGVALAGLRGYVADGGAGLRVLDLTNPAAPTLAGSLALPGVAYAVTVNNGLAYVAAGLAGLQVVNVVSPAAPQFLSSFDTPGLATGLALRQSTLYLADGSAGLWAFDITNPANPTPTGRSTAPLHDASVAAGDSRLVIGDDLGGPVVFAFQNAATGWNKYE